ncbi:MAG: hypothetical protein WCD43_01500 [Candidatus Acidiferrales bacterium]
MSSAPGKSPADVNIKSKTLQGTVPGSWGLQQPNTIYSLKGLDDDGAQALYASVYVRKLNATGGSNTPAYNVNIADVCHYSGGDIHDNNGVTCVKNGPLETQLEKELKILPGDAVSYQIANGGGNFEYDIFVEAYYQK